MKRETIVVLVALGAGWLVTSSHASGQLTVTGSSALGAMADTDYNRWVSTTSNGTFSYNETDTYFTNGEPNDWSTYYGIGTATQNAVFSPSLLSGSASCSSNAYMASQASGAPPDPAASGFGGSMVTYRAVFSVAVPTEVNLAGNLAGSLMYISEPFGDNSATAYVTLTNSQGTLYSVSETCPDPTKSDVPTSYSALLSYSTILEPGQSYTLTAYDDVYVNCNVGQWETCSTPNDASSNFTLTVVPEPGTISLLVLGGFGLLIRRRRGLGSDNR